MNQKLTFELIGGIITRCWLKMFRYLSFKYQITRDDWHKPHLFLLGEVKFKIPLTVHL